MGGQITELKQLNSELDFEWEKKFSNMMALKQGEIEEKEQERIRMIDDIWKEKDREVWDLKWEIKKEFEEITTTL